MQLQKSDSVRVRLIMTSKCVNVWICEFIPFLDYYFPIMRSKNHSLQLQYATILDL